MTNSRELTEPFSDEKIDPAVLAVLRSEQPSLWWRAAWVLIIFCMGVAATLAWQSYGDATKELIVPTRSLAGRHRKR